MEQSQNRFLKPTEELRNLQLLEEIYKDSNVSQRKLSKCMDVALGVTNACLKKMVRKGHIKIKGVNHKRITYYLTPQGFTEKTRLTYNFLQYTVSYYINLKKNIAAKLDLISQSGIKRLLFYGAGEVMEVAFICLHETNLQLIGIVDDSPAKQGNKVFGFTILKAEAIESSNPEAILVTSLRYKDQILSSFKNNRDLDGITVYSL